MGRTAGSNVRTSRALERLAELERQVTGGTRDSDVVRSGLGQVRRAAARYRTLLRKLQRQISDHECFGEAGANVDGWIDWMARGPAPGVSSAHPSPVDDVGSTDPTTTDGEA